MPVNKRFKAILDEALGHGSLHYADGETVQGEAISFLITQNRTTVYSVVGDVPVLLETKQVLVPE